jgi:hypothetical protein
LLRAVTLITHEGPAPTPTVDGDHRWHGKVLVLSISDIRPNEWYLLDMEKSTMNRVAQSRPGLEHIPTSSGALRTKAMVCARWIT